MQNWKKFILDWSAELNAQDLGEYGHDRRSCDPTHGFGSEGASEQVIQQAEQRLGVQLPASYREFLLATNGLNQPVCQMPATGGDYLRADQLEWFRVKNDDWIQAWSDLEDASDDEYFVYGEDQDSCCFRKEYLNGALQISDNGDAGVYLLNPAVKDSDGEWEAWHLANWMPGASRYESFEKMLLGSYAEFKENDEETCFGF